MSIETEHVEQAVLGAILLNGGLYHEVAEFLHDPDFYIEAHRLVYRAIVELSQNGDHVDLITVTQMLREKQCITRAGGPAYVSSLVDSAPDVVNVVAYAKELKKAVLARKLKLYGKRLIEAQNNSFEVLNQTLEDMIELSTQSMVTKEVQIGDISKEILDGILDGNGVSEGLRTGFAELDRPLGGLCSDELVILAARPSVGKSAFSLQVAANVAKRGHHVLYISPEMSSKQLGRRLLSVESGVDHERLLKSKLLTDSDIESIRDADARIRTLPLEIDDGPHQTVGEVRTKARIKQARTGLSLVMVDYLQLLSPGDDDKAEVTKISKGLKGISKDLNIPVWAVSQLSRGITFRESKRPELGDLRGSGQLEQDADKVMFLWYPTKSRKKVEVFIEKNRNGPLGSATYNFNHSTTRFESGSW